MLFILAAEATIVWSMGGWAQTNQLETTHESGLDLWFADFRTAEWVANSTIVFTFLWKGEHRWEGQNWQVNVL